MCVQKKDGILWQTCKVVHRPSVEELAVTHIATFTASKTQTRRQPQPQLPFLPRPVFFNTLTTPLP